MRELKYRVVVVNPELLIDDLRFRELFKLTKFTSKLFNVTFDEGHCISQWGGDDFRPEYKKMKLLQWLLPPHVRYHIASATMPPLVLEDIRTILPMREGTVEYVRLSNDRPNIHYAVEDMRFSAKSMLDLDRVFKIDPSIPPPKFMIFTNKRKECERVVKKYQDELPPEHWNKIIWFHSGMSKEFKEAAMEKLRKGEIWGIVCTDAAGMVSLVFLPRGSVRLTSNRA
jgi:superfamily II DNA helicase RecQ